jgi:tyrosine-protein kinase
MARPGDVMPPPPLDDGPRGAAWPQPPDLRSQLQSVWRRKWIVIACLVVIPAALYLRSARQPKLYQSNVLLQVQSVSVDTSLFEGQEEASSSQLKTAARLIETTAMARAAARRLRPRPADPSELVGSITATPDEETNFITITATSTDPETAANIANAYGAAVRSSRADRARAQIAPAIRRINRNLAELDPGDTNGRRQLSEQLQRLRALYAAQGNNAQVIEPAAPSSAPVSPQPRRNAMLGLVLAIFVGVGLVFLIEVLDRRIRDVDELERITGLPLLGIVPVAGLDGSRPTAELMEAFQTVRASLTYFNIDRRLTSVAVCSPLKGDGKTTVATNLARTIARTGKRVTLVDTDLRRPQVDARVGNRADMGLGDVLVGEATLPDVLLETEVEGTKMRILPSGAPPPNPSELIASGRMRIVLTELVSMMDLVIIDTPPILQVADSIPLLEQVSGVIVIARLGKTTREEMRRLMKVIDEAGGTALGLVATAVKTKGLYGYGAYGAYGGYGSDWSERNGSRVRRGRDAKRKPGRPERTRTSVPGEQRQPERV